MIVIKKYANLDRIGWESMLESWFIQKARLFINSLGDNPNISDHSVTHHRLNSITGAQPAEAICYMAAIGLQIAT